MQGNAEIHQAFREALKAATFRLPIHWQNMSYTPDLKQPYLEEHFLPAPTATPTMGDLLVRAEGIYQITCVYPFGKGSGEIARMADAIIKKFRRGTNLIANETGITITNAWASPVLPDSAWIRIPISLRYFSYITP